MRRFVCICTALLISVLSLDAKGASIYSQLAKLSKEYDKVEGFEVTKVGGFMMDVMKLAMKSGDKDELEIDESEVDDVKSAYEIMKDVKGMLMVDYEDASAADKAKFCSRVEAILSQSTDVLMETNEEGETVKMYGKIEDEATVRDLIIYTPDALVCFNGKIAVSEAMKMTESND